MEVLFLWKQCHVSYNVWVVLVIPVALLTDIWSQRYLFLSEFSYHGLTGLLSAFFSNNQHWHTSFPYFDIIKGKDTTLLYFNLVVSKELKIVLSNECKSGGSKFPQMELVYDFILLKYPKDHEI